MTDPDPQSLDQRPPFSILAGLFFMSMAVLTLEIIESRIFSFILWHHLGFMVVSIAMLGLAAAGSLLAARSAWLLARVRGVLLASSAGLIASLLIGHYLITLLPLELDWWLIPSMGLLYLLTLAPFVFAGMGMALPFRLYPASSPRLYMASMLGSAVGAVMALYGLSWLGAERMLFLISLEGLAAGLCFSFSRPGAAAISKLAGWAVAGGVLIVCFLMAQDIFAFPVFGTKMMGRYLRSNPSAHVEVTGWTPYCRIDIVNLGDDRPAFGDNALAGKILYQDGEAPSWIINYESTEDLEDFAKKSVYSAGYLYQDHPQKMLIIGAGGGLEAHLAVYHEIPSITVVEINPFTVKQVKETYSDFTRQVYNHPNVNVINAEARGFLHHSQEQFDLITVSGVDTHTSLTSGAYVLTESYLYTQEAMSSYLDHLTDDGAVLFSAAQLIPPRETLRIVALMVQALRAGGAAHPEDHMVITNQYSGDFVFFNLVVKKQPFTPQDLEKIRERNASLDYQITVHDPIWMIKADSIDRVIIYAPDAPGVDTYSRYLTAIKEGQEQTFQNLISFDLTGITDDSPYFFKYDLFDVTAFKRVKLGQIVILAQLLQTSVLAVLLILWPLRRLSPGAAGMKRKGWVLLYFGLIGLGYLLVEISLMQKLVLFLGNPTYSISITLTVLLFSSGLGAIWFERKNHRTIGALAALVVAALVFVVLLALPPLVRVGLGMALPIRIAIAAALIFPLGFVMGIPFPSGLVQTSKENPDLVPWAWGINSSASVMAAILCVPLAMSTDFSTVFIVSAMLYLLAAGAFGILTLTNK